MFSVENESVIQASPARIWTAILLFEDYHRWNPFVRISGVPAPGAAIDFSFRVQGGETPFRTVDARIVAFEAQKEIAVRFGLRWLCLFEESYSLTAVPEGTRLVHGFRCTGLASLFPLEGVQRGCAQLLKVADRMLERHLAVRRLPTPEKRRNRRGPQAKPMKPNTHEPDR